MPRSCDPRRVDLDELRALIAVVETGSFSAAAKSLRFARATLRRRIDELEARMGTPLLLRDAQRVRPTPAGALLVERGPALLTEARSLFASIRRLEKGAVHELRIVGLPGPPPELMALAMRAVGRLGPDVRVRFSFDEDPSRLADGAAIAVDIASAAPVGPFRVHHVADAPVLLLGSRALLRERPVRSLDDLEAHRIVAWRNREGDLDHLALRDGGSLSIAPMLVTSDIALLRSYAAAGVALVYAPDLPMPPGTRSPLVPVLPELVCGHTVGLRILVSDRDSVGQLGELIEALASFVATLVGAGRI